MLRLSDSGGSGVSTGVKLGAVCSRQALQPGRLFPASLGPFWSETLAGRWTSSRAAGVSVLGPTSKPAASGGTTGLASSSLEPQPGEKLWGLFPTSAGCLSWGDTAILRRSRLSVSIKGRVGPGVGLECVTHNKHMTPSQTPHNSIHTTALHFKCSRPYHTRTKHTTHTHPHPQTLLLHTIPPKQPCIHTIHHTHHTPTTHTHPAPPHNTPHRLLRTQHNTPHTSHTKHTTCTYHTTHTRARTHRQTTSPLPHELSML